MNSRTHFEVRSQFKHTAYLLSIVEILEIVKYIYFEYCCEMRFSLLMKRLEEKLIGNTKFLKFSKSHKTKV